MSQQSKRFAIVGAGPMGLMAAMEILKAGHEVDIYERDDRIGGMSAAFDFDGLQIERYYHFVCKTDDPLFELMAELGISDTLKWTDTKMGFYCQGRLYKWGTPLALLRFDKLGWVDKFRYALHVMRTKGIRDWRALDKVGVTDWLKRNLGARAYDVLWERLFHLKFYEYKDKLSAAWLGTRIKRVALSRRNLFQESMGYIEGGSETLLKKMQEFILARGGRIHLSAGIERINAPDGKVQSITVRGETVPVDGVVSTAPIQYVPRLAPDLPADFIARIQALENIPVVCVILKLKQPLSENFWMNICDDSIDIPGVIGVFFGFDFITVTKSAGEWHQLKPQILGAIMEHFMSGAPLLREGVEASESEDGEFYDVADEETVNTIKELIETRVRPAVANDGGDITFRGFKDGIVYLNMKGSCAGCPSSTATLQHGIQNLLKHFVPDVVEVRPM